MNYLDLFHGIGGFALGAYWAGMKFENHYCSDIEPWCQKLYAQRFPESIQLGDITKIKWEELPHGEWIISGGFPCQDISIAGKGEGITGARSGLWFTYHEAIRILRPRFAIMENVGMLVHRGLREVLGSLAEIGYDAEWQDIRASDMGAPHRRERIWIVAYPERDGRNERWPECEGQRGSVALDGASGEMADTGLPKSQGRNEAAERGKRETCSISSPCGDVADAKRERGCSGRSEGENAVHDDPCGETIRHGSDREWWSTEPDVGRVAHGIHHRMDRLKGLGNAIVPQIAELLFRQIKELL
jgi:DNA (cytosine-5)-methyltransferase 1